MKKMMIVLIAALTLVACNNSAETPATTNDSTVSADSTVAVDSTVAGTTTATTEVK